MLTTPGSAILPIGLGSKKNVGDRGNLPRIMCFKLGFLGYDYLMPVTFCFLFSALGGSLQPHGIGRAKIEIMSVLLQIELSLGLW